MKLILTYLIPKLLILIAALFIALTASYLYAIWNEPTDLPPAGNAPTPLNVGSLGQVKSAGLTLTALLVNGPVQIQDGTESSGRVLTTDNAGWASWQAPPDTSGGGPPVCADGEYLVYDTSTSDWTCDPDPPQNRITGACPAGQAIQSVNADGTVMCETIPVAPPCTNGGAVHSTGYQCFEGPGAKGTVMVSCSFSNPDSYSYITCQSDGTWQRSHGCYDADSDPQPYPSC